MGYKPLPEERRASVEPAEETFTRVPLDKQACILFRRQPLTPLTSPLRLCDIHLKVRVPLHLKGAETRKEEPDKS